MYSDGEEKKESNQVTAVQSKNRRFTIRKENQKVRGKKKDENEEA